MRTITLLGESHKSIDDFFDDVARQLNFPESYMHNFREFGETLAEQVASDPATIIWKNHGHARNVFGVSVMGVNYFPEMIKLLSNTNGVTLELE